MSDPFLRRAFVALVASAFAIVFAPLLFPTAYREGVYRLGELIFILPVGEIIVIVGLLAMGLIVFGGTFILLSKARLWLIRKRGPGYYKYKDPEKMDASSRNPKESKTYLFLRPWQWFVVLALTTVLTVQVEPIEPFDALPLGVHLGNAYIFAVVVYSLTVLLTIASRSAMETRKRPRQNRE